MDPLNSLHQQPLRFAEGIRKELYSRVPFYWSDFRDGLTLKVFAAVAFLFFACIAPAIAFGALLSILTEGSLGVVEMLVGTAISGLLYSLLAGQPIVTLNGTGPVVIFMGLLYEGCSYLDIPYLSVLFLVGMWTMVILVGLALLNASNLMAYFTRFTDEVFAGLIALIFIYEALSSILEPFRNEAFTEASALLGLVLSLGTYMIASSLAQLRRSPYLRAHFRNLLADFGPTIALGGMTYIAFQFATLEVTTLAVPENFATSSGRPWLVDPTKAPLWVWLASSIPAALLSILLFINHSITMRIVSSPQNRMRKPATSNCDLALLGFLVGASSVFGLPWIVGAIVPSINHLRSLSVTSADGKTHESFRVIETRLSGIGIYLLMGISLYFLELLALIPMAVIFGLFLYMGVASTTNNQLFERLSLWFMDPTRYPETYYLRRVRARTVHAFTAIQVLCLAALWMLKSSPIGLFFPLFVAALIPLRFSLERFLPKEDVTILDLDELSEDLEERVVE